MILDSGICRVFRRVNEKEPGVRPTYAEQKIFEGWYGELNFETAPAAPTPFREEIRTDARIRILQDRRIANHDIAVLKNVEGAETRYRIRRAYHGTDDDSGELITDLTLEKIEP